MTKKSKQPKWVQCNNPKCRYRWISKLKGTRIPKECPLCKRYGVVKLSQ